MKKGFYLSGLLACCCMFFSAANAAVPYVTVNPIPDTACSGSIAAFYAATNDSTAGAPAIGYTWQVSTDGGATWSFITDVSPYSASVAGDTLYVAASNSLSGYRYRSVDTNADGADTSLAAMLTVDTLNAGTINLSFYSLCLGTNYSFNDVVAGGVWGHGNPLVDTLFVLGPFETVDGLSQGFDTITYSVTNVCGTAVATHAIRVDTTVTAMPVTGPTATCVGHSIDLTNTNVLGTWSWSLSNATAALTASSAGAATITGASYGLDTVHYNFSNACSTVSSSLVIATDTVLYAGAISGSTSVCTGSWISLTESVTGGIWLSSSADAIVDGSGNVTGVSAGVVTISYLFSNACGEIAATHMVTVDATTAVISGGDSVGVGATLALSGSVPGGTWSVADTIATIDSAGIVTGIVPGTTEVMYTVISSCGTISATMTLYVGHAPNAVAIDGPDSVCIGATITLSDTSYPGGVWFSSNNSIATVDASTGVVTGDSTGYVTIFYAIHNAFGSDTINESVFVNQTPSVIIGGPSAVSLGQNYYIDGYPCCGSFTVNYDSVGFFIGNGTFTDTLIDTIHYPLVAWGYFVVAGPSKPVHHAINEIITYSLTNSCGSGSATDTISLPGTPATLTPVINAENRSLNVYPNPNQGEFILYLNSGTNEQVPVIVTNIAGEKVQEISIATNTSAGVKLNQPAGVYFLSANASNGQYTAKITITN